MAQIPKIVIGSISGVPVLGTKDQSWSLVAGTRPFIGTFDVPRESIGILFSKGGVSQPHTLTIGKNEYKFVYIVNQRPADNPHMGVIVVADRRIWWSYTHVTKRYNMRRRVGSKRRGLWQDELQQDVVPEIQYASYSIDPSTNKPWVVSGMLLDFFTGEDGLAIPKGQFKIDAGVKALQSMPVDNIQLEDPGDRATARILAAIPGAEVAVDPDGSVRILNTMTGGERAITGEGSLTDHGVMGPEIVGGGHVEVITNELVSPSAIDVYFVIEQEVRMDFKSGGKIVAQTVAEQDIDFILENVAPIPDFDLEIDGETFFFGTFAVIEKLLEFWTDNLPDKRLITEISASTLDKAIIPGVDFWGALDLLGQLDADANRANWSARIAALKEHYLTTFRIHSEWVDRFARIKAELVATIDNISGQRAPARAFSDHAYIPSRKGQILASRETSDSFFAVNVDGYPGDDVELTDLVRPSPAEVTVLDEDQGIIKVNYKSDPFGFQTMILPAKIFSDEKAGARPAKLTGRKSQSIFPVATNALSTTGFNVVQLDPVKRTAVLLSAIPAAPNSKQQHYRIRVNPGDVASLLPGAAAKGLLKARGPVQQTFIGAGLETARSRWKQTEKETIKRVFGMGGTLDDVPASSKNLDGSIKPGAPSTSRERLRPLVVNDDDQQNISAGLGAASLPAIARAAAASIWARHAERVQGSITGPMQDIRIEGSIREIRAFVDGAGAELIQANLPAEIPALSFFSFMDASTRNIMMKVPK